jgi:3-methylcrotonyl-CoA carboxylase alpha subunit
VDTGFRCGDAVSPYYDPMLAKLIVWGEDRERARRSLLEALSHCEIAGVSTNVELLERIVAHPAFAHAELDTGLIERHRDALLPQAVPTPDLAWVAAAIAEYRALARARRAAAQRSAEPASPWNATDGWWNGSRPRGVTFRFADASEERALTVHAQAADGLQVVDGASRRVAQVHSRDGRLVGTIDGERLDVAVVPLGPERYVVGGGLRARLRIVDALEHAGAEEVAGGHLAAPMSGTIVAVLVEAGARVGAGDALVVLEAMKMEHTITAPAAGVVTAVNCRVGERVSEGADLVDLGDAPGSR